MPERYVSTHICNDRRVTTISGKETELWRDDLEEEEQPRGQRIHGAIDATGRVAYPFL
jgi:hypothetical protein